MNLSCNIHAASFEKGAERDEYDDVKELQHPLGLSGKFLFTYDYPLTSNATFRHELTPEMTGEDLLVIGRSDYERIYKEEEDAVGNPGHYPGMLNRASSSGPYGIWGHDFSDLYFEGVRIGGNQIRFEMGS